MAVNAEQAEDWNGASGREFIEQRERHEQMLGRLRARLLAAAAIQDGEYVLPGPDPGAGQQPRRQPALHPLMPLTMLDELPPAGPVPVLGLLRIHGHDDNAASAQPAWTGARLHPRRSRGYAIREFRVQPLA